MTDQNSDKSIDRRRFCAHVGLGSLAVSAAGSVGLATSFLTPNVLYETPTIFDAGTPDDYEADSVTVFVKQRAFIICTPDRGFYALSAVCTHLGCITNWKGGDGVIACPCHGSHFEITGQVLTGPATRPLERYLISLSQERRLVVDTSTLVDIHTILRV